MQTRKQLLGDSKHILLGIVSTAITLLPLSVYADSAATVSAEPSQAPSTQSAEITLRPLSDPDANAYFPAGNVLSPEQKVLLVKEQELLNKTVPATQKNGDVSQETPVVSAGADVPSVTVSAPKPEEKAAPKAKVYNTFPYERPKAFESNPLVVGDVRLGYRPSALDPMGNPLPQREKIMPPDFSKIKGVAKTEPVPAIVPETPKKENAEAPSQVKSDEVPALTAFLDWVHSTDEAAQMARKEVEKKTQVLKERGTIGMFENDLFLTIRFPYIGALPPPATTATIYSVPPTVNP